MNDSFERDEMESPDPGSLDVILNFFRSIGGIFAGAATIIATMWGAFVWRNNRQEAKEKAATEAQNKIDAKVEAAANRMREAIDQCATKEQVERHKRANDEQVETLRSEIERRKNAEVTIFAQQREDKTEILAAIGKVSDSVSNLAQNTLQFQAHVARELGDRPTRTELSHGR